MDGLLKQKNFVWLWLGQLVSSYGDRLNQMACVAMVSTLLPGSTLAISFLFTASQLPVLILGPILGVYVDRWDSKKCMIYCDVLRCVLVLMIPLVMSFWPLSPVAADEAQPQSPLHNGWLLFLTSIVFCVGALTRIFVPARLSLMPVILERRHLLTGNAVLVGTIMLATVLGLASGDVILGWIGWRKGFLVDALTFLVSGAFILMILVPKHKDTEPHDGIVEIEPPHFGREFLEGIKILVSHRAIFLAIGSLCMLTGGAGAIFVLITVYIKSGFPDLFAGGAYGVFLGTVGLGAIVGSLILTWCAKHHSKERLIAASFLLTGIISLPFVLLLIDAYESGTMKAFLRMDFVGLLVGMFVAPVMISCDTWLQEIIPERLRGRVFATKETLITLSFVAVNIPIGKIADQMSIGNRNVLMIAIAVFLSLVGFTWSILIFKHEAR